jgi:hypothetical protein
MQAYHSERLWKSCARVVNFLLTVRDRKFFFDGPLRKIRAPPAVCAVSSVASLDRVVGTNRMRVRSLEISIHLGGTVTHDVHRFEQSIAGRPYLIEVAAVAKDRWRAYIVRLPGMPTALMPFYGSTPDEAAQHLSAWLARAYERASKAAGTV